MELILDYRSFNGLEATLTRRLSHGWMFRGAFSSNQVGAAQPEGPAREVAQSAAGRQAPP
jgi:hypothetical protein